MIALPTTFTKNQRGFEWKYRQVARRGLLAIFHRTSGPINQDWEVIRIRENKAGSMTPAGAEKAIEFPARESYPVDNDWGSRGWSFITEQAAWEKFDQLREEDRQKALAKEEAEQAGNAAGNVATPL